GVGLAARGERGQNRNEHPAEWLRWHVGGSSRATPLSTPLSAAVPPASTPLCDRAARTPVKHAKTGWIIGAALNFAPIVLYKAILFNCLEPISRLAGTGGGAHPNRVANPQIRGITGEARRSTLRPA